MCRCLLISPNTEKNPFVFPLGIGYINAHLKAAGIITGVVDCGHIGMDETKIKEIVGSFLPNYVGISIRNVDNCCMSYPRSFIDDICNLVYWVREVSPKVIIILGGAGFSILPEQWMEKCLADFGIIGGNSYHMGELIKITQESFSENELKQVPGLIFKHNNDWKINTIDYTCDVEHMAIPYREGYLHPLNEEISIRHNVQTKKGCNLKCSYCAYPILEGNIVQPFPIEHIIRELQYMEKNLGIKEFDFIDSVFNLSMIQANEICEKMIESSINMKWGCFMHPSFVSYTFLENVKRAGCQHIEFGIDSANELCLKKLNKNFGKKEISTAITLCQKLNIEFNCCLIIGGEGETEETLVDTLNFLEKNKVKEVFGLMGVRILPNTLICDNTYKDKKVDELLQPTFYFSPTLTEETARKIVGHFKKNNPNWIFV